MKIEFVGGAGTVTGSSYILKSEEFTIMVDCGMFQGSRELKERNRLNLIYAPSKIDAMLLTHAHIDHSGLIPKLVHEGFTGPIYATDATVDLCSIMLPDSAHVQEMDNEWINRRMRKMGRDPVPLLYTAEDAEKAQERFAPVRYGDMVSVHPRVKARFRDAGHILGSAFIELWVEEKGATTKIVFSGDVGSNDQAIIRDPERPDEADILLIESTYGDRLHKSKKDTYAEFKQILLDSYNKKGNIIIPSFAIERTQEIIYTLGKLFRAKEIPPIPVYIDSPLAIAATEIFKRHRQLYDEEILSLIRSGENPLEFPTLSYTKSAEESRRLNEEARGAIIISASGMCTAGRIKYHLMNNLYRPESSVVFVGFQAEGTLGRRLVDGEKRVSIYGEDVVVKAKIHTLGGFSAHADRDNLLEWMGSVRNNSLRVFVVHGEENASRSLAASISERSGYRVHVPRWGEIVDPGTMASAAASYGPAPENKIDREMDGLKNSVELLIRRYEEARKAGRIFQATRLEQEINDLTEKAKAISKEI